MQNINLFTVSEEESGVFYEEILTFTWRSATGCPMMRFIYCVKVMTA